MTCLDWIRTSCVILVGLTLPACGDDGGGGTVEGSADAGSSTGETGSTTSTTNSTGSSGGTSSTDDGSTGSETGSTTGVGRCQAPTGLGDVLFPLEVGQTWAFELLCSCEWDGDTETREVTGTQMIGGREAFVLETDFGSGPNPSYWTRQGQAVDRWNEGLQQWDRVLEEPVEEGYEWGEFDKFHWEPAGEVTVPAGTFADCWTVIGCQQPDVCYSSWTYCPGIGPVLEGQFESSHTLLGC